MRKALGKNGKKLLQYVEKKLDEAIQQPAYAVGPHPYPPHTGPADAASFFPPTTEQPNISPPASHANLPPPPPANPAHAPHVNPSPSPYAHHPPAETAAPSEPFAFDNCVAPAKPKIAAPGPGPLPTSTVPKPTAMPVPPGEPNFLPSEVRSQMRTRIFSARAKIGTAAVTEACKGLSRILNPCDESDLEKVAAELKSTSSKAISADYTSIDPDTPVFALSYVQHNP